MTLHKLFLVNALGLAFIVGCTASRTQMTSQIHQPLQSTDTMGDVAVVSVVSADKSRPSQLKRAAEVRKSLEKWLRNDLAVHDVVESLELPPLYGTDRNGVDAATLLRQASDRLRGKPVDTICLVQLKDIRGDLSLGLAIPPQKLVSVQGKCDYQLQLFDVRTGRELFCSTGTWSERTDAPMWPVMPSASHFGEQIAQAILLPAPPSAASPELVAERSLSPAHVATATRQ